MSEQGEVGTINNLVTGVGSVLDGESLLTSRRPLLVGPIMRGPERT